MRGVPTPLHLKPATAAWISRERKRLGMKPRDLVERLAAQGLEVTEATIKVWESNADRKPSPYNLEGLERIFGSKAPVAGPGRGDTVPGLADLVAAISSLVAAIEQDRQERTATRKLVEENRQKIDEQDQSIGQLTERLRLVEAQLEATGSDAPGGSGGLVAAGRA